MSSARKTPADQPVRDRLAFQFDTNFLVEAGAGSGKTHSLAARMAGGIASGKYSVERLTVVTFTRKAAAELRGRFQAALEERLRAEPPMPVPSGEERYRLETALAGIERLVAGTIHSFCARLLRERPVDARIAPGFEELGDIDNLRMQRDAWRDYVNVATARGSKTMLDLFEAGVRAKELFSAFQRVCEHEDVEFDMGAGGPPDPKPVWREVERFWKELSALRPGAFHEKTTCQVQQRFEEFEGRLRMARRDRLSSVAGFLGAWRNLRVTQKFWGKEVGRPSAIGKRAAELVERFRAEVVEPFEASWKAYIHRLAMQIIVEARDFYAEERRRQNVVNYVDLLRVTAAMLKNNGRVRRALQERYPFLLVDEFQDTDPIQAEIFLMLAADESRHAAQPDAAVDPFELPLRPGALFVVGDPKQSIFRFRRADIDTYNRVADRIVQTGGEVVKLTANFRSLPSVCDLANTVFPPLFGASKMPYSPAFVPLDPVRSEEAGDQPAVAKITVGAAGEGKGGGGVEEEARLVAAYIRQEVEGGRRKYGDFLVLARQTPRLGEFVKAFDALRIPVDVSGAGLFCGSEEVKVLAALLRALADPLDSVALTGVLRGRLFGHSDCELFAFRQAGGKLELLSRLPSAAEEPERSPGLVLAGGPVLESMKRLQAMWRETRTLPAGAAVDRILEETGWLALAATTPGGAPAGHLLQAIDRVREIVEDGGGLAEAATALEEDEASNEAEALPLEPGRRNVVRLMNLHKAKGLEAGVVVLADATHAFEFPLDTRIARGGGGSVARGYLRVVRPADEPWKRTVIGEPVDWAAVHEPEEQKYRDAERDRLLYVAGTRAKDLLVVCRSAVPSENKAWGVFEEYLAKAPEVAITARSDAGSESCHATSATAPASLPATQEILAARDAAGTSRRERHEAVARPSWAVTSVTGGERAGLPADGADVAPASTVEGDTCAQAATTADAAVAWGSLVHGLLEHAAGHPRSTRPDFERLARWLASDSPDLEQVIPEAVDLVQAVSTASFWKEAQASGEAYAEVPFAVLVPAEAAGTGTKTVVRGVIDLVHRAPGGWRIFDYKATTRTITAEALAEWYGFQLQQYEKAWERATNGKVVSAEVVPVRAGGPGSRHPSGCR
ncbi:MAG: UvrD-helicase domain-containing protein [Vicinamibacterales bacterium]